MGGQMERLTERVRAAQAGDRDAFEDVIRQFQDMAYAAAYARVRDHHLAQDASQDAFITAYTQLSKLKDPQAFAGWFRSILFHQCSRILRRRRMGVLPLEDAVEIPAHGPLPLEAVMEYETRDRVREAVEALPEHERSVTTLFYIGEQSLKDISSFLDIPVATVKTRLHSARKRLKESMMELVMESLQSQRPSRDETFAARILRATEALSIRTFTRHSPYRLSPDGERLAYTVQEPGREEDRIIGHSNHFLTTGAPYLVVGSELWVKHLPTGTTQRLTPLEGSDWSLRWSPDGRFLAFYSDREGEAQLWMWDWERNTQRRVSKVALRSHGGFEGPQRTPDGAFLLVRLRPESETPEKVVEDSSEGPLVWEYDPVASAEEQDTGTIETETLTWPSSADNLKGTLACIHVETGKATPLTPEVHTYAWDLSSDGSHVVWMDFAGYSAAHGMYLWDLKAVSLRGGEPRTLAAGIPQMSGVSFSVSPNGNSVAYFDIASREVCAVPVGGGEPVSLTASHAERLVPGFYGYTEARPLWSRDSRFLYLFGGGQLWKMGVEDRKARKLTEVDGGDLMSLVSGTDGTVAFSPDGEESAYALAFSPDTKRQAIFRVDLDSGHAERLHEAPARWRHLAAYTSPESGAASRLYYVAEDATRPPDLWQADTSFKQRRQVTRLNPHLEEGSFGAPRLIEWTAQDGRAMKGALLVPAGHQPGQQVPVILFLYPGGTLSDSLHEFGLTGANRGNFHILVSRGYGVLAVDMPLQTNEPLKEFPGLVLPALDKLEELGIAEPGRYGVMGHSYGGYGVNCLITRTPRFKAAVSLSSISDLVSYYLSAEKDGSDTGLMAWAEKGQGRMEGTLWEQRQRYIENSPVFHLDSVETPLLLLHGEVDRHPPVSQSVEMFAGLRRLEKAVSLVRYPGEGHQYVESWRHANVCDLWGRILDWFGRYLRA